MRLLSHLVLLVHLAACGGGSPGAGVTPLALTVAPTATPAPAPTATAEPPASTATAAAPTRSPATPTTIPSDPSPTPRTRILVVANTGGDGVFLRAAPRVSPETQIRAWAEGAAMEAIGDPVGGDGQSWQQVRDPDGTVGYVVARYLAPR